MSTASPFYSIFFQLYIVYLASLSALYCIVACIGACGYWGCLAVGVLGRDDAAAFAGYHGSSAGHHPLRSYEQLVVQFCGATVLLAWALLAATLFLLPLSLLGLLRDPHEPVPARDSNNYDVEEVDDNDDNEYDDDDEAEAEESGSSSGAAPKEGEGDVRGLEAHSKRRGSGVVAAVGIRKGSVGGDVQKSTLVAAGGDGGGAIIGVVHLDTDVVERGSLLGMKDGSHIDQGEGKSGAHSLLSPWSPRPVRPQQQRLEHKEHDPSVLPERPLACSLLSASISTRASGTHKSTAGGSDLSSRGGVGGMGAWSVARAAATAAVETGGGDSGAEGVWHPGVPWTELPGDLCAGEARIVPATAFAAPLIYPPHQLPPPLRVEVRSRLPTAPVGPQPVGSALGKESATSSGQTRPGSALESEERMDAGFGTSGRRRTGLVEWESEPDARWVMEVLPTRTEDGAAALQLQARLRRSGSALGHQSEQAGDPSTSSSRRSHKHHHHSISKHQGDSHTDGAQEDRRVEPCQ